MQIINNVLKIFLSIAFILLINLELTIAHPISNGKTGVENVDDDQFAKRDFQKGFRNAKSTVKSVFQNKEQKNSQALKDIKKDQTNVKPSTLKRLDTKHFAILGPEHTKDMSSVNTMKVQKEVSKRIQKHAEKRDKALHVIGSPFYNHDLFTNQPEIHRVNSIERNHGHHQDQKAQRVETKKLSHKDATESQDLIHQLQPLHNIVTNKIVQEDVRLRNQNKMTNRKEKKFIKAYDNLVKTGTKMNYLDTEKMLDHQKQTKEDLSRKNNSYGINWKLRKPYSSVFEQHPNRIGSQAESSKNPPIRSYKLSFEGKEEKWTDNHYPSPHYFLGNKFVTQSTYVQKYPEPLAKTPQMSNFVHQKQ